MPRHIRGTNRNDVLKGGNYREIIDGYGGNDKLYGGGGSDTIRGGKGKDLLWGGRQNDVFEFDISAGDVDGDIIKDFHRGDLIRLETDMVLGLMNQNGDTVIIVEEDHWLGFDTITVENASVTEVARALVDPYHLTQVEIDEIVASINIGPIDPTDLF